MKENRNKKEWLLNIVVNRWQLNRPKFVGKVSEEIRKCQPKNINEWIEYYRKNVRPQKYLEMKKHIPNLDIETYINFLGMEVFKKINEIIKKEVEDITEEECVNYIKELIFDKTFQGFIMEKETVYSVLEKELNVKLHPAGDEWDRKYNIDFYIKCEKGYIGIQIKPITYNQTPQIHNWMSWLKESHEKFRKEVGGEVFTIFYVKDKEGKKYIHEKEAIIETTKAYLKDLNCL